MLACPTECSTWTPRSSNPGRAWDTAALIRCAPWEPPNTSRTRPVGGEAQGCPRLGAFSGSVQGRDRPAQRDADALRAGQRAGHRLGDVRGEARAHTVGQSGAGVGLVDDQRCPRPTGSEVGRQRDVPTEADHDIGADVGQDLLGLTQCVTDPTGERHEVSRRPAGQGDGGDHPKLIAAGRHKAPLEALLGAQGGDADLGIATAQGVGEVQGGFDVPRGATSGQHDVHPQTSTAAARPRVRAPARTASWRAKASSTPMAIKEGSSDDPP